MRRRALTEYVVYNKRNVQLEKNDEWLEFKQYDNIIAVYPHLIERPIMCLYDSIVHIISTLIQIGEEYSHFQIIQ